LVDFSTISMYNCRILALNKYYINLNYTRMNMNVKSMVIGAAFILVGFIVGYVIVTRAWSTVPNNGMMPPPPFQQFEGYRGHCCEKFNHGMRFFSPEFLDEIGATDEQKNQIRAILDAKRSEMEAHRKEMRAERDKVHAQIMQILTADQKALVEKRIKEGMCKREFKDSIE